MDSFLMTEEQFLTFLEMASLLVNLQEDLKVRGIRREDVRDLQRRVIQIETRHPGDKSLEPVRQMSVLMSRILDFFQM